jgi:hypothetical protein
MKGEEALSLSLTFFFGFCRLNRRRHYIIEVVWLKNKQADKALVCTRATNAINHTSSLLNKHYLMLSKLLSFLIFHTLSFSQSFFF